MRIGLYGMPTSGKTHILDRIDFIEVLVGSKLLREYDPDFDKQPEHIREQDRKAVANIMLSKKDFIMDGHYAFGDTIAFTEEEGNMYDVYLYLYIEPAVLRNRIKNSPKNQKYAHYDVEKWQSREIDGLREYCHKHNKDFYVVDNPPTNTFEDVSQVIEFIKAITDTDKEIKEVIELRKKVYNKLRRCDDDNRIKELKKSRDDCTTLLRQLRKEKKIALSIIEDEPKINKNIRCEIQAQNLARGRKTKARKKEYER